MKKKVRSKLPSEELFRDLPSEENIVRRLNFACGGVGVDFEKLTKAGADRRVLRQLLLRLVVALQLSRTEVARGTPPGMEWHTLKRLPARLKDLAGTIEQVNAHPFLAPSQRLSHLAGWKTEEIRKRITLEFEKLPHVLRWYADYLEGQTAFLGRFARRGGFRLEKWLQLDLLDFVRRSTGKYYYERVARLLTAAFRVAGQNKEISPQALKLLHKRNPLFHTLTGKS